MLDWIGSLRVHEHTPIRVVLRLSRTTGIAGWAMVGLALYLLILVWPVSLLLLAVPAALLLAGVALVTMQRELTFDREAGVLTMHHSVLGMQSRSVVPLFYLRAVVIEVRSPSSAVPAAKSRYVAYVERRKGGAIYLDESRRCASLLEMAEAIAEAAEIRLEYDAMSQAGDY